MAEPTTGEIAIRVTDHDRRLDKNDEDHTELWNSLDSIKNRLPAWATILIAVLTAAIGALLGTFMN